MKKTSFSLVLLALVFACSPEMENQIETTVAEQQDESAADLLSMEFPLDFDFGTTKNIEITIQDTDPNAEYSISLYQVDLLNNDQYVRANQEVRSNSNKVGIEGVALLDKLYEGSPSNGSLHFKSQIPSYIEKLYVRRKQGSSYKGRFVTVDQGSVQINENTFSGKTLSAQMNGKGEGDNMYLIAVNGLAEVYLIDPMSGETILLDILPEGSNSVAYNPVENAIYAVAKEGPFELMRKFDVASAEWTIIGNVGTGEGHRMAMSPDGQELYFSNRNRIRTMDPATAQQTSNVKLNGVENTDGGDIAFSPDGTLYIGLPSGIYELSLSGNAYNSTKIHDTDLPINPTGLAFDADGTLWISDDEVPANLVTMDVSTGSWQYQLGTEVNPATEITFAITDLAYGSWSSHIESLDSDGDGVADGVDAFPEDPTLAYKQYFPSENGWMTFMVEDLWPYLGDYDFNDTAMEYRYEYHLNADNQLVKTAIYHKVVNDGAGMTNGFGLAFRDVPAAQVSQVSGSRLFHSYVNLANTGVESNQSELVVILTDDHEKGINQVHAMEVVFTSPMDEATHQSLVIDPFLIVKKQREREIHLPFKETTDLGDAQFQNESTPQDEDGDFKTPNGLPWALQIQGTLRIPKEKTGIDKAYNFFQSWAQSGGNSNANWYLDVPGHINKEKVK